jgi:hypothetical protein
MADTDYPSKLILVAFFIQEQKAGTKDERDEFSQELFDTYDALITDLCDDATPPIEPSAEARALMAIMAVHAPGSKKKQAEAAVGAYLIHRGR